jgi:hypothetical protein
MSDRKITHTLKGLMTAGTLVAGVGLAGVAGTNCAEQPRPPREAVAGVGLASVAGKASKADNPPTTEELEGDCAGNGDGPNGVITGNNGALDGCTYEEASQWDDWSWKDTGDTVTNCTPGVTTPIDHKTTGTETWTSGWTIGGSATGIAGGDKPWGQLAALPSYNWSHSYSVSNENTIHVNPGRKGSLTVGAKIHHSKGRIRVNYSNNHLAGHYIWYINGVQMDTPTGDKQIGQEDKACSEKLMNGQ